MKNVKRILVPVDFSSHSRQAALRALELAQLLGASVTFMHVVDSRFTDSLFAGYLDDRAGRWSEIILSAEKQLDEFVAGLDTEGVDVSAKVMDGIPSECVKDAAADLVVMGSRGRTGVDRLVCGSQTEQVVRHVQAPVLIVHAPLAD